MTDQTQSKSSTRRTKQESEKDLETITELTNERNVYYNLLRRIYDSEACMQDALVEEINDIFDLEGP